MFLLGLLLTCFSVPIGINMIYSLYLVSENPYSYRFTNGFSEESVAFIAVLAFSAAIIGICLMVFGIIKRRNKAALDSIKNYKKADFCKKCNLNVSSSNGHCPICGDKLE